MILPITRATLRTARCSLCKRTEIEKYYGSGWAGWSIVYGISPVNRSELEDLTIEKMTVMLCPEHTRKLSDWMTEEQIRGI